MIHYSIQFCTPYTVEAYKVEKVLQEKGINLIHEFIDEIQISAQQGGSPIAQDAPGFY